MRTNGRLPWSFMLCLMLTLLLSTEAAVAQGLGVGASIDIENISCLGRVSNDDDDDDDDEGDDDDDDDGNGNGACTYAAKFLCGEIAAQGGDPQVPDLESEQLAPGSYRTVVNIYNPSDGTIDVLVKIAKDDGIMASSLTMDPLGPMSAEQLDCRDILGISSPDAVEPFTKGFVVLEPDIDLAVTAVYTFKNVDFVGGPKLAVGLF